MTDPADNSPPEAAAPQAPRPDPQAFQLRGNPPRVMRLSRKALAAIGVAYFNERLTDLALDHLRKWVDNHPEYKALSDEKATGVDEVAEMYKKVVKQGAEDPEPRVVLGVLYNLSQEYDDAADVLREASRQAPNDYTLWNKLGATQANSAQSEESLHAYHQALETRPNYVRAWINVGMSFVNQGNYNDACQYYLRGLNLNPEAVHVWNYLRTALSLMDRQDLVSACDAHDITAFQAEFDI